jgi:hypothetical protein
MSWRVSAWTAQRSSFPAQATPKIFHIIILSVSSMLQQQQLAIVALVRSFVP